MMSATAFPRRRRRWVVLAAVSLATSVGCGPKLPLEVGVQEVPGDLIYGEQERIEPAPRPPGVELRETTAPGFVAAPIDLAPYAGPSLPPPTSRPTKACPEASPTEGPDTAAPSFVAAAPKAGRYRFRHEGFVKYGKPGEPDASKADAQPLADEVIRTVTNVTEADVDGAKRISFDVVEQQPGLKTTTSYLIDPVVGDSPNLGTATDPGLKITRIVTERADLTGSGPGGATGRYRPGVESFNPQPPVKIMDLPMEPQPPEPVVTRTQQYSRGTDPLSGASMEVFFHTVERHRVDVCGTVLDTWLVRVSIETHGMSNYDNGSDRRWNFAGTFAVAPQLGGLIVADDFMFGGPGGVETGGRPFEHHTASVLSTIEPERSS